MVDKALSSLAELPIEDFVKIWKKSSSGFLFSSCSVECYTFGFWHGMRQSAAAASPTLFEFAVLSISFCLRLLPTRKLQNRNEFSPGKPNKRNRLFPLGSFESNILWNTTYFRARRLGTFIPGSWRIAARITSLQYLLFGALTRKKLPLLTTLPGSSTKIIRDLRKPNAAFVCLHAFVIAAFQLFNICHRVKSCMNFEVGGFQNRKVCPQAFPPSLLPSPLLLFFALALFLAGNACCAG